MADTMRYDFATMMAIYDLLHESAYGLAVSPPSPTSIAKINAHLDIELPGRLIDFASYSSRYGCWGASLGEDYRSDNHIIRINSRYKRMRRRRHGGRWRAAKPESYVVLNEAHDDDCICLDRDSKDERTGEYHILYWYPGMTAGDPCWDDFEAYLHHITIQQVWNLLNDRTSKGHVRARSMAVIEKAEAILGEQILKLRE